MYAPLGLTLNTIFTTHFVVKILSRLLVTIDGVWIGEQIYLPLTGVNYK
jgi:hypothetical protein